MKYEALAKAIVDDVGGPGNVADLTHCVTRLRFKLNDESLADTAALKATKGVLDVVQGGAEYQVVIGPQVDDVFDAVQGAYHFGAAAPAGAATPASATAPPQQQSRLDRVLGMVMDIFRPVIGLLIASGMIKAALTLCTVSHWLHETNGTYIVLAAIGDALFYFFPVILGWSAAKRFGLKEGLGMALGGVLVYPTLVNLSTGKPIETIFSGTMFAEKIYTTFFGIPLISQTYSTTVIPIILIVFFAAKLEHWLNQVIPALVKSLLVPLLTLLIAGSLGLLIIGPVALVLQDLISKGVTELISLNPGIAGLILGSLWSILVVFGLHWAIIPLFAINVSKYGYDVINPLIYAGAPASVGAALGVFIRARRAEDREIALPAALSSFFGVNEPCLYGVLLPRKKLMAATFLAAGVGGMIAGFSHSKLYAFSASGPLGTPGFLNPHGVDGGFIGLIIGGVVALLLALGAALALGAKKDVDGGESLRAVFDRDKPEAKAPAPLEEKVPAGAVG